MNTHDEKHWFETIVGIIQEHRACALGAVNVEHLLACWQIGAVLSAKIKQDGWGRATIDRLVDFIHANAPDEKGYGRSNLYSMVGVYEAFSADDFTALVSKFGRLIVQPTAGQMIGARHGTSSHMKFPGGIEIVQPAAGQPLPPVLAMTTFSNLVEILNRTKTAQERLFYIVYALSRTMRPAMVAEYKRVMIPKEVLRETFESYLSLPSPESRRI